MANQGFLKGFNKGLEAGFKRQQKDYADNDASTKEAIDDELTQITKSVNALKPRAGEDPSEEYVQMRRLQIELMAKRNPNAFGNREIKSAEDVSKLYKGTKDDPSTAQVEPTVKGVKDYSIAIEDTKTEMELKIAEIKAIKSQNIAEAQAEIAALKVPVEDATNKLKDTLEYDRFLDSTWKTVVASLSPDDQKKIKNGTASADDMTRYRKQLQQYVKSGNYPGKAGEAVLTYHDVRWNTETKRFESATLLGEITNNKDDYKKITGIDVTDMTAFNDADQSKEFYVQQYKKAGVDISDIPSDKKYNVTDASGTATQSTFTPNAWDDMDEQIIAQYMADMSENSIKAGYTKKVQLLERQLQELVEGMYYGEIRNTDMVKKRGMIGIIQRLLPGGKTGMVPSTSKYAKKKED